MSWHIVLSCVRDLVSLSVRSRRPYLSVSVYGMISASAAGTSQPGGCSDNSSCSVLGRDVFTCHPSTKGLSISGRTEVCLVGCASQLISSHSF